MVDGTPGFSDQASTSLEPVNALEALPYNSLGDKASNLRNLWLKLGGKCSDIFQESRLV